MVVVVVFMKIIMVWWVDVFPLWMASFLGVWGWLFSLGGQPLTSGLVGSVDIGPSFSGGGWSFLSRVCVCPFLLEVGVRRFLLGAAGWPFFLMVGVGLPPGRIRLVCAILCRREVQLPTATVCSSRTSYRLRSPIVRRLPSLFVGARPRLPDCDRQNTCFEFSHCCCCETWTQESRMCAIFSGVCRDTDPRVKTCVQVPRESDPSATAVGGAVVRL